MRNISFMHTMQQFKTRTKTVTRRTGWLTLKAGDVLCAVEKGQGRSSNEGYFFAYCRYRKTRFVKVPAWLSGSTRVG
jgi:hypothetical protein